MDNNTFETAKANTRSGAVEIWSLAGHEGVELVQAGNLGGPLPAQVSFACKIVFFEQGARRFQYGRRRLTAHTGDLLLIPPGEVHGADAATHPFAAVRVVSVEEAALFRIADELGLSRFTPRYCLNPFVDDAAAIAAFRRLHRSSRRFGSALETQFHLMTLLECLSSLVPRPQEQALSQSGSERICRIKQYLEERYAEDITLNQLAQLAGLTPPSVCRAFRKAVGVPPHTYLVAVRIARARTLLAQGCAAGQTALETGFCDQSHLNRVFNQFVRMPPAEYARQVRR